jgi:two-component system KDP operon response regulator KdpE
MTARVVLIDDDPDTVQTVQSALFRVDCTLQTAPPVRSAWATIVRARPDLIILGINDSENGWAFGQELLALCDAPLFLLLASRSEVDRVRGLDMGAVDCVSKTTCTPIELTARLRATLRRRPQNRRDRQVTTFVDGDLVVDLRREEVWLAGELVSLTPTEFCLLACLARQAGRVLPHRQLLTSVWATEHNRPPAALRPHIHKLRQKLEPDPARPQRIVTRRGMGYLLQRIAT